MGTSLKSSGIHQFTTSSSAFGPPHPRPPGFQALVNQAPLSLLLKLDTQSTGCIFWWREHIKRIEIASQQTTLENATITVELVSGFFVHL
jgi:hypothetical protein